MRHPLVGSDVGLEERELSLTMSVVLSRWYNTVYHYNGAQQCEQLSQVGRLDQALILLDLALCLPSTSVSSVMSYLDE